MSRIIGSDAALAASAALAVVLSGLALGGYSPRSFATAHPGSDASSAGEATGSASPSISATPKPAATITPLPANKVVSLGVIGDSASNDTSEWVNELGSYFGLKRSTDVRRIFQAGTLGYNDPMHYGTADPALAIWNASSKVQREATPSNVKGMLPSSPTMVLISQGRDLDPATVNDQLTATTQGVKSLYPDADIVVVLQPVGSEDPKKSSFTAVRDWAKAEGLPTIDVAKAFASSGKGNALQDPDGEVTAEGQIWWARAVYRAISGA